MEVTLHRHAVVDANLLAIEVGTNCPQGGDSGHGGRTQIRLIDEGGTDMRVSVKTHFDQEETFESAKEIILTFGGDAEYATLIECLEFAIKALKSQANLNGSPEKLVQVE